MSDSQLAEQYDMDLALRFLTLRQADPKSIGDVHEFLRDRMEGIALDDKYDQAAEEDLFRSVFKFLDDAAESNAFRPWSERHGAFRGGFSLASFEGLGLAIGRHWDKVRAVKDDFDIQGVIKELWSSAPYRTSFSGLRARERMARVAPTAESIVLEAVRQAKKPRPSAKRSSR